MLLETANLYLDHSAISNEKWWPRSTPARLHSNLAFPKTPQLDGWLAQLSRPVRRSAVY
jgi:hypothetical protein